jgi:hypothetical protein
MIWEDDLIRGEWLGEEVFKEPINTGAKVYGVAEDQRFCDIRGRCDSGWHKPGNVKECSARNRMLEELRKVADVGVIDGEVIIDVISRVEAERDHHIVEGLIIGKCCTDSYPGGR